MIGKEAHRTLFLVSISGIGFSLPLSEFLTTLFIVLLTVNWITEVSPIVRIRQARKEKVMLVVLIAFMVYVVWMVNSSNPIQGLHNLRLKLPLLLLPLVIASSGRLNSKSLSIILTSFVAGVLISTVAGYILSVSGEDSMVDPRELSLFISHIRLSLMVCLALFIIYNYGISARPHSVAGYILLILLSAWLVLFMFIMISITGILIFASGVLFTIVRKSFQSGNPGILIISVIVPLVILFVLSVYIFRLNEGLFGLREEKSPDYSALTQSGNSYSHYTESDDIENGYYVWWYICEEEMKSEWNSVSGYDYSGSDEMGHEIRFTLIRYLTSLGLRKDSAGVVSLSEADIGLIEKGYANKRYLNGTDIRDRIEEVLWQIDFYRRGGNPQGHSLTQRIEYMKTGWRVFRRFPVFGTGTGDLTDEFSVQYRLDHTVLDQEFRRISHNQFLTSLATFGIAGFILFWMALIIPILLKRNNLHYLFYIFIIIAALSMIGEDTLETHTGVTFFAFFYSLFLFNIEDPDSLEN